MNKIFLLLCLILITGCLGNAFRPGPPEFKGWKKQGVIADEVKQQMLICGYRNAYAPDSRDAPNDVAKQEICMFNEGYEREKSGTGYKGACYLTNWKTIPACVEYRKNHP